MNSKKMIPCRVCGKMFEPCSHCSANSDKFQWRNFACSRECAEEYVKRTLAYRAKKNKKDENVKNDVSFKNTSDEKIEIKKAKRVFKKSVNNKESE